MTHRRLPPHQVRFVLFCWRRVTVRSRAAMFLIHGALQMLVSPIDTAYRESVSWMRTHREFSFSTFVASVSLASMHNRVMRRFLYGALAASTSTLLRCGTCISVGHQLPRCPLFLKGEIQRGGCSPSCRPCVVFCAKCGTKEHSEDTLADAVRKGMPARLACQKVDEEDMHDAMMPKALPNGPATREVAQAGKKRSPEIACNSGSRVDSYLRQSAVVDEFELGSASAMAPTRMSEGFAADLKDDSASRAASRFLGVIWADSAPHCREGSSQPPQRHLETLYTDISHKERT